MEVSIDYYIAKNGMIIEGCIPDKCFNYREVNSMSLMECISEYCSKHKEKYGFNNSVINLCDTHNKAVTEELKKSTKYYLNTRVYTLLSIPVVEETHDGITKCIICEGTNEKNME